MFWTKKKRQAQRSQSLDEMFSLRIKKFQLKNRVRQACTDTTNYEEQLRNFLERNKNNQKIIIDVAGYRSYLIDRCGLTKQKAAKEILEHYRHS